MPNPPPVCPACHQPIREMRLGVRLPPVKAAIVDAIKAAGDVGISSSELPFRHVKSHVCQINDILEETDFRIVASARGASARWHLIKRRVRAGEWHAYER
jgi:hypothetical protein